MGASPPVPRVILAGEPVLPSRAAALYAAGVGELVNACGASEDTICSTLAWIPRGAGGCGWATPSLLGAEKGA